jgi:hypothetical protein
VHYRKQSSLVDRIDYKHHNKVDNATRRSSDCHRIPGNGGKCWWNEVCVRKNENSVSS